MGKQIDADKLIEHFINKTSNGWLVPICENESRWTLEGIISEIEYFVPTVEAIPKDQYEARLKADMVAMLTEIQLEIAELPAHVVSNMGSIIRMEIEPSAEDVYEIIQQRINALKAESEEV